MVRTRSKALARCQYIALLACVAGMLFCWTNAALRLYGPSPLLSWATADISAVLGAVESAYAGAAELATKPNLAGYCGSERASSVECPDDALITK
jgi:hypothetical protein